MFTKYTKREKMKRFKNLIVPTILIAAVYIGFHLAGVGCPIKFITGISCFGCGMSRAALSLLSLDFKASFHYHPLLPLVPIGIALVILNELGKIPKKLYNAAVNIIIALFIGVWLLRMFFGDGQVVSFSPRDGIFFKIFGF